MLSIQLRGVPQFVCHSCGGTECRYAGSTLKLDWDFPCTCDRCGARSRLRGVPRYLASTLALIALRRNWIYLLGAPLFGPFEFVLVPYYGLPHSVSAIAFFATLLPAFWPILAGRAPLAFWVVALGLWMAGGIAGIPLRNFLNIGQE